VTHTLDQESHPHTTQAHTPTNNASGPLQPSYKRGVTRHQHFTVFTFHKTGKLSVRTIETCALRNTHLSRPARAALCCQRCSHHNSSKQCASCNLHAAAACSCSIMLITLPIDGWCALPNLLHSCHRRSHDEYTACCCWAAESTVQHVHQMKHSSQHCAACVAPLVLHSADAAAGQQQALYSLGAQPSQAVTHIHTIYAGKCKLRDWVQLFQTTCA
jgi:hypothetical protein